MPQESPFDGFKFDIFFKLDWKDLWLQDTTDKATIMMAITEVHDNEWYLLNGCHSYVCVYHPSIHEEESKVLIWIHDN